MLLWKTTEGGSECVLVQMLLPANNQKEVLKLVSPLSNTERKKKQYECGFKIFMNL